MLIVKPYGQSVTTSTDKKRVLKERAAGNPVREFSEFNATDPRILIAQWISVVDKIIKKPNQSDQDSNRRNVSKRKTNPSTNDLLRQQQIKLRQTIGDACWKLLLKKIPEDEQSKLRRIWEWKLNPAGTDYALFKNDAYKELNLKGRWYQRFLPDQTYNEIDPALLADDINSHLNDHEWVKAGGFRANSVLQDDGSYQTQKRGLIRARADSVAENSLLLRFEDKLSNNKLEKLAREVSALGWSNVDEKMLSSGRDLAAEIYAKNKELERDNRRIDSRQAARIIFDHYRNQFGVIERKPTRQDIMDDGKDGLLNLYDSIRAYYKKFLKNTGKGRKGIGGQTNTKLSVVLPKNDQELIWLLGKKHTNAITNDLIRLGRIIHYESSDGEGDKATLGKNNPFWAKPVSEFANSRYWTSDGQSEIKRTEAFVRVWRNVLSQGARAARAFGDPQGAAIDSEGRPGDALDQKVSLELCANAEVQKHASDHTAILFGSAATLFTGAQSNVDIGSFVYSTLRLLANIRNKGFHFKGRRTFVQSLKNGLNSPKSIIERSKEDADWKDTFEAIQQLLTQDQTRQRERLYKVCEGAQLHKFASPSKLTQFFDLVECSSTSDFVLPKLNRLLVRVKNTDQQILPDYCGVFPDPASEVELKNPARLSKFVALKLLYERSFRNWIETLPYTHLVYYVEQAIERGTFEARKINKSEFKDLIVAKATLLPRPVEGNSIGQYMEALQAFQASDMRIQKGYESDSEVAKKQSEWIENFRSDIVSRAFGDYLYDHRQNLDWLLRLKPETKPNNNANWVEPNRTSDAVKNENWIAAIYFVMHLVPVDDVSRLLHQFRKWGVLERKAADDHDAPVDDTDIDTLKKTLTLYLDMHDDKHDGEGVANLGLEPFRGLFEGDGFDAVFKTQGSDTHKLGSTRRGLREIMRFGHLRVLNAAMGKNLINAQEISKLQKFEAVQPNSKNQLTPIAQAQLERKKLHSTIMKAEHSGADDLQEYAKHLKNISLHRKLANKVRLNNHIRLHRLMMRVVARLVDYAGLWERDGYFISLALMKLQSITPDSALEADWVSRFHKDGTLPNFETGFKPEFLKVLNRFHSQSERSARNDIAHFNILANDDVDLSDAVNKTRQMMAYDRKLKNAVSKSILDMLSEEGFDLTWKMENHKLKLASIKSRTIHHLNGKVGKNDQNYQEEFHDHGFVSMAKHLFEPDLASENM